MKRPQGTLARCIWNALRRDLLLGLPFVPLYSAAEVAIAFSASSLLQLIFVETPRVPVASLVPESLRGILTFGQTLDRKDLAFTVPLVVVLAGFVKLVSGFLSSYLIERAGHRAAHAMRSEILRGFLSARGNTLDSLHVDDIANRVLMDTTLLQNAVSKGTVSVIRDGCVIVFIVLGMFVTAFKAMLVSLVVIVPLMLVLRRISTALTYYTQESAARQVALSTRALQSWNGRLTVHALRARGRERDTLRSLARAYYAFIRRSFLVRTAFRPGTEVLAILLLAVMLQWKFRAPEGLNPATLTTLLVLGAFVFRPLKQVSGVIALATDVRAVYARLASLWDSLFASGGASAGEPAAFSARGAAGSPARGLAIEVEGLVVRLTDGRELLSGCSLRVPLGSRVALVGESGAGKTTFLRAVAGLLEPAGGTVRVAEGCLLATQQPYVFKGTVRDNVLYRGPGEGPPSAVEEDRLRSLLSRLRLAHSAVGTQVVADKGVGFLGEGLSGGEKARVALARLLFISPRILLLDEPTANLDPQSAAAFWDAVDDWKAKDSGNTVVAVSHALHEVAGFDRVCVFREGRIVREDVRGAPSGGGPR